MTLTPSLSPLDTSSIKGDPFILQGSHVLRLFEWILSHFCGCSWNQVKIWTWIPHFWVAAGVEKSSLPSIHPSIYIQGFPAQEKEMCSFDSPWFTAVLSALFACDRITLEATDSVFFPTVLLSPSPPPAELATIILSTTSWLEKKKKVDFPIVRAWFYSVFSVLWDKTYNSVISSTLYWIKLDSIALG